MADDMRPDDMTIVADAKPDGGFDWIRDHGVQFERTWTADNVCCPGRATMMTGQTPFNHGVYNIGFTHEENILPEWMRSAGYCTAFTGKWRIGYDETKPYPPGWDYWEAVTVTNAQDEYQYDMFRRDGTLYKPGVFLSDQLGMVSEQQFNDCDDTGKPAFITMWPLAPHIYNYDPEPDYANYPIEQYITDPSFNEADISDKPAWMQRTFAAFNLYAKSPSGFGQKRLRSLLSVDDAVKQVIDAVAARGEIDNTVFILTSDNGYMLGEHRAMNWKVLPYEAAQPTAWISGPGFPVGVSSDAYAMNIDIVPTIARAGGAHMLRTVDGKPLQDVLVAPNRGHDRFLPFYVPSSPAGEGIRTWRYKFARYADGSRELYDLFTDPNELNNKHGDPAYANINWDIQVLLKLKLKCKGDKCRTSAQPALQG